MIHEPVGGAHADPDAAANLIAEALRVALKELVDLSPSARLEMRYQKFRSMGLAGIHDGSNDSGEADPESAIV